MRTAILTLWQSVFGVVSKASMCGTSAYNRGRYSSVSRAFNWKGRHSTNMGSSPQCSKGFFSQSQLQVQTLIQCLYSTPCAIAYINLTSVHMLKIPHWQPYQCLDTKILHTEILVIRMDNSNTALATAVPYPGKVARISHKHQWSMNIVVSQANFSFAFH